MKKLKRYRLREDVCSYHKDKRGRAIKYGERGQIVEEVADYVNVKIVADRHGKRFSVHIDKLIILNT